MKKYKGISLIVLVITIIVIVILASSVILSLVNNNPVSQASEATLKSNVLAYNYKLSTIVSQKQIDLKPFDTTTFNAKTWNGIEDPTGTIKEHIPEITDADAKKFEIQNSVLVYVGNDAVEKQLLMNIGIANGVATP